MRRGGNLCQWHLNTNLISNKHRLLPVVLLRPEDRRNQELSHHPEKVNRRHNKTCLQRLVEYRIAILLRMTWLAFTYHQNPTSQLMSASSSSPTLHSSMVGTDTLASRGCNVSGAVQLLSVWFRTQPILEFIYLLPPPCVPLHAVDLSFATCTEPAVMCNSHISHERNIHVTHVTSWLFFGAEGTLCHMLSRTSLGVADN